MRRVLLGCFLTLNATASLDKNLACLTTNDGRVNIKYVEINDDVAILAYVKYKNSTKAIPLILQARSEEEAEGGRPSEVKKEWLELFGGKVNGTYEVISQGANYYGFTYQGSNGRRAEFRENFKAYKNDNTGCAWE